MTTRDEFGPARTVADRSAVVSGSPSSTTVMTPGVTSRVFLYVESKKWLVDRPLRHQSFRPMPRRGHPAATAATPDLTVDQAADELDVPPAWLAEQLDAAALPSVGDGADRRVPADAVRRFRRELYKRRCRTLDELTAWDQDLGLI